MHKLNPSFWEDEPTPKSEYHLSNVGFCVTQHTNTEKRNISGTVSKQTDSLVNQLTGQTLH